MRLARRSGQPDPRLAAEAAVRARAQRVLGDPVAFVEAVVTDERTGRPVVLAPHHREALAALRLHARVAWLGWPGCGKSTLLLGHVLHTLAREPNLRALYVGPSQDRAARFVDAVRRLIEASPEVAVLAPHLRRGALWTSAGFSVERSLGVRHESLKAIGVGSRIVGQRVDLLVLDDIVDISTSGTRDARGTLERHVRLELLPRLAEDGRVVIVGAPFHPDDLLGVLSRDRAWHLLRHPAVLPDGSPRWPEAWPRERLEEARRSLGTASFEQLFELRPPDESSGRFRRQDVYAAVEAGRGLTMAERFVPGAFPTYVGIDPAFAQDDHSDLSAIVVLAVVTGAEGKRVNRLVSCRQGRWTADELAARVLDAANRYRARTFVEGNAAQRLLVDLVRAKAQLAGTEPPPISTSFTTQASKADRLVGLEAMTASFERREWMFPSDRETGDPLHETKTLVDALLDYSPQAHAPDSVMAAWIAWRSAMQAGSVGWCNAADVFGFDPRQR